MPPSIPKTAEWWASRRIAELAEKSVSEGNFTRAVSGIATVTHIGVVTSNEKDRLRSALSRAPTTAEVGYYKRMKDYYAKRDSGKLAYSDWLSSAAKEAWRSGTLPHEFKAQREEHRRQHPAKNLDERRITAKKEVEAPRTGRGDGYGNKIPTSFMLQIDGKPTWHRIYVINWSNSGSAYILIHDEPYYLGSYDPRG